MNHTTTTHQGTEDEIETEQADVVDVLCWQWAAWTRSRRLYGPPPIGSGTLGRLTAKSRGRPSTGPNAINSAELSALHLAIIGQPEDVQRQVFELHYLHNIGNVKAAAAALGISRAAWYRHLNTFRTRIHATGQRILADNLAQAAALPHAASIPAPEHHE